MRKVLLGLLLALGLHVGAQAANIELQVIIPVAGYAKGQIITDQATIASLLATYGAGYFQALPAGSQPGPPAAPGGLQLPTWTTATRPTIPTAGMMGVNNTTGNIEAYIGGVWTQFIPAPGTGNQSLVLGTGSVTADHANVTGALGYQQSGSTVFNQTDIVQGSLTMGAGAGASLPANSIFSTFGGWGSGNAYTDPSGETTGFGTLSCNVLVSGQMDTCVGEHALGSEVAANSSTALGNDDQRNTVSNGDNTSTGKNGLRNGSPRYTTAYGEATVNANAGSVTITGTVTPGDSLTLTLSSSVGGISNLPASAHYTVQAGDTLTSIAAGLTAAIDALPSIGKGNIGLSAINPIFSGGPAVVSLDFPGTATTGWQITITPSCTGTCTEVMTVGQGFTGTSNDVTGYGAMYGAAATTAGSNSIHGANSMPFLTTGNSNATNGFSTGYMATTDNGEDYSGFQAGYSGQGTSGNVFHGFQAGFGNLSGNDNNCNGNQACYGLTSGSGNLIYTSCTNYTPCENAVTSGSHNLMFAYDGTLPSATASNQLNIGNFIWGVDLSGFGTTISPGRIGLGTQAPTATLTVGNSGGTTNDGHIAGVTTAAPTLSSCGTSPSIDIHATDIAGTITEGSSATGCVLTFTIPYGTPPHVVVSSPNGAPLTGFSVSTTALTITNASASGNQYSYVVIQ